MKQVTVLRAFMRALKQVSPEPVPEGRGRGVEHTRSQRAPAATEHFTHGHTASVTKVPDMSGANLSCTRICSQTLTFGGG